MIQVRVSALLFGAGLVIALFAQSMASPLASSWLFFVACSLYLLPRDRFIPLSLPRFFCFWWIVGLAFGAFILQPVANGGATLFILISGPVFALSLRKEQCLTFVKVTGVILALYALNVVAQMVFRAHYSDASVMYWVSWRGGLQYGWPFLDPNNAACFIMPGVIASFYMFWRTRARQQRLLFAFLFLLFAFALCATGSDAGALVAALGCGLCLTEYFGIIPLLLIALFGGLAGMELIEAGRGVSLTNRLDIWRSCFQILHQFPWRGVGLGQFAFVYQQVRTETMTLGYFAHNDFLQLLIECGIPIGMLFIALFVALLCKTTRANIGTAAILFALAAQACLEFQFYVPAISLLSGIVIACHMHLSFTPWGTIDERQNYQRCKKC